MPRVSEAVKGGGGFVTLDSAIACFFFETEWAHSVELKETYERMMVKNKDEANTVSYRSSGCCAAIGCGLDVT